MNVKLIEYEGQVKFHNPEKLQSMTIYALNVVTGLGAIALVLYGINLLGGSIDQRALAIFAGYGHLFFYPAGLLFIVWFYKAYKNIQTLDDMHYFHTPKWAYLGFFVPFANLFVPYQIGRDLLYYSLSSDRKNEFKNTNIIGFWWFLYLFYPAVPAIQNSILGSEINPESYQTFMATGFISSLILIAGSLITKKIVIEIGAHQHNTFNRLETKNIYSRKAVCPSCGTELRSKRAKQCPSCLISWRVPDNPVYLNTNNG